MNMRRLIGIFRIRREEWWVALVALIFIGSFLSMMVAYATGYGSQTVLHRGVVVSGFDNMISSSLNRWHIAYSTMRHPLLAFLLWPLSEVETWMSECFGGCYSYYIIAVVWGLMDLYSFLFIYRTLYRAVELRKADSIVLTMLFFSFGFVMLGAVFPDHMAISLFILSTTLYVSSMLIRKGEVLSAKSSLLLFLFSTGVTTTNGIKIILADLITLLHIRPRIRVRAMLRHFLYYVLPITILVGAYWAQDKYYIQPVQKARWERRMKRMKTDRAYAARMSGRQHSQLKFRDKQIMKGKLFEFTDQTVPSVPTLVHNVFGESLQLHSYHLLDDPHGIKPHRRPQFVEYQSCVQYGVELLLVVLLIAGIALGFRKAIMWVPLSWFLFDMLIHVVLKFAINDVFIMTVHWALVFPVAFAFVLKKAENIVRLHNTLTMLLAVLTVYLLCYNGRLIAGYLL